MLQWDPGFSLLSPAPLYMCQMPIQRSGASGEDSVTSRVLAGELGHYCHVKGVPVAHQFLFGGERELGCPKGPAVISTARVTHGARVDIGPVGHLIASGFLCPPDDPIGDKVRVSSGVPDDGSCGPGSSQLARLHRPHRWLIQGDPVQVIGEDPLAQGLLSAASGVGEGHTDGHGFLGCQQGFVYYC